MELRAIAVCAVIALVSCTAASQISGSQARSSDIRGGSFPAEWSVNTSSVTPWVPGGSGCQVAYLPGIDQRDRIIPLTNGTACHGVCGKQIRLPVRALYHVPTRQNFAFVEIPPGRRMSFPKGSLDGNYGIDIFWDPASGFPTPSALGQENYLQGELRTVPGDQWSQQLIIRWSYVRVPAAEYDAPAYCRANGNCLCVAP